MFMTKMIGVLHSLAKLNVSCILNYKTPLHKNIVFVKTLMPLFFFSDIETL